jgi:signal transduction histidine kinase
MEVTAQEQCIVVLAPTGRDSVATTELLTRARLAAQVCQDLAELISHLGKGVGAALIAEEALTGPGYDALTVWVNDQPAWSDLPFIILSSRNDSEALRARREKAVALLRNVSLLERPVQGVTLVSALRFALRSRTRQYEVRAHLEVQKQAAENLERLVSERTHALETANEELNRQIAERQKVEEQLRHAQKMEAIGQLTGGLAHDFNNMLAIIVGALNLLKRRLKDVEPGASKYIESAQEGAYRAAQLTQRLLAFSRQQALRPETLDVNKLVNRMSELLRGTLGRDITLEAVAGGGLWEIYADESQLENAILNVALNARDAMPDGGRLTIETQNTHLDERYVAANLGTPPGQYVMISVTDTGEGMSPDVVAKAFDPFFTTKGPRKGTGLGLSQVYGFVRQSGGHIKIYSEPGRGTSVKIYLPRHHAAGNQISEFLPASRPPPEGRQELILVVDDEDAVRSIAVDGLGELGYRVLEAPDARTALALMEEYPTIDLLFTDIVMPEVNGRKLAEQAQLKRPGLKILFTSGCTRNAIMHSGVVDAGVHLIGKPFSLDELAEKVRDVLDRP